MAFGDAGQCAACGADLVGNSAACPACGQLRAPAPAVAATEMPTGLKILFGILAGGSVGLGLGIFEVFVLAASSGIRAPCPGGGACDYAVGAVICAWVLVAVSVAALAGGIWLAIRRRPGLGSGVMTAAIIALLPPTLCGLGLALGGGQ